MKNENLVNASKSLEDARKNIKTFLDEHKAGVDYKNVLIRLAGLISTLDEITILPKTEENQISMFDFERTDDEEYNKEIELLEEELKKDDELDFVESNKCYFEYDPIEKELFVNHSSHYDNIIQNIPFVVRNILQAKWSQKVNPDKVIIDIESDLNLPRAIVKKVEFTNEYGVKFNVQLIDVFECLNKIDFDVA